ncbi:MAG: glutamine-hydrolyzing carbamoyl-phosphate synthase small subunit [Microthrixaceae bacterium]
MTITEAALVLSDGSLFEGEAIGARPEGGVTAGEVVFNTVLSGYQEVLSDPSYAGQIVTFTYPHIGNYGATAADNEAPAPHCSGVVVRDLARRRSNWRADADLDAWLSGHGLAGIAGVDTRRLTRHLRDGGAVPGVFGTADESVLRSAAAAATGTDGTDLTRLVTTSEPYVRPGGPRRVVAVDFGIKATILSCLEPLATVTVVPAGTGADDILALEPEGVFLSNGPGDPAAVAHAPAVIAALLGQVPIFGICMGHQLLATALGASTYKLPFGHHGGNHPVQDRLTNKVEITSQNHNYCVDPAGIDGVQLTHVNLNDETLEGFVGTDVAALGIQYHPEAGPGPHDSRYLFDRFAELIDARAT